MDENKDPTFQPINEANVPLENLWERAQEINRWLQDFARISKHRYAINSDLSVDVYDDIIVPNRGLTTLPFKFRIVHGEFNVSRNLLTDFTNFPDKILQQESGNAVDLSVRSNGIQSIQGMPSRIQGDVVLSGNELTNLKDIHKHCKQINGILFAEDNLITSNILGVLLITGLHGITLSNEHVMSIINGYLGTGTVNDVNACQEELIDAGFEQYARL